MLELQRAAGNAATNRVLARRRGAAQPVFRVVVVEEPGHGILPAVLQRAVSVTRSELGRVTGRSRNPLVRRGVSVETRNTPFARGEPADLGSGTFVVYVIGEDSGAADGRARAVARTLDIARQHLGFPRARDADIRAGIESRFSRFGGANVEHDGRSVSFVMTSRFVQRQGLIDARPESMRDDYVRGIGTRVGEVMVHELGHALGVDHVHDRSVMDDSRIVDMEAPFSGFNRDHARAVRERFEGLDPARPRRR